MLKKHEKLEKNSVLMLVCVIFVVLIGGIVEIIPLFRMEQVIEPVKGVRPYTPLELSGYNIFIREGCYNCHSQQVRPLRDEVERYGHYSLAAESMYDHPFQWGSKRTGPDLARVGGKYSDDWHARHMINPRDVVPESIMPAYAHLAHKGANLREIREHLKALKLVGVPYSDEMLENAYADAVAQARDDSDTEGLKARYGAKVNARDFDGQKEFISELDALIAYLQVLGTMVDFRSITDVTDREASPQTVSQK
jgi:cytochrome c oxidase cbb3-type subunit 2